MRSIVYHQCEALHIIKTKFCISSRQSLAYHPSENEHISLSGEYIIKATALYIINSEGIAYHPSENEYISLSGEYIINAKANATRKITPIGVDEIRSLSAVWNQGDSLVWNHHGVMYVINPKEKYTLTRDAMPSLCDGFHTPCG